MVIRREEVEVDIQLKLIKDLCVNEIICESCLGSGLIMENRPFGIKGMDSFPYTKSSIVSCLSCYSGVQSVCELCDKVKLRGHSFCGCIQSELIRAKDLSDKENERWYNSNRISLKEAIETYDLVYIYNTDMYVDTSDLESYVSEIFLEAFHEGVILKPEDIKIYGTSRTSLNLDVIDILENSTEDLHEDALSNISKDKIDELSDYVDIWCEDVKADTTTFWVDYSVSIEFSELYLNSLTGGVDLGV